MEQIFKKGDKVFCYNFGGWGDVIEEREDKYTPFTIRCSFPIGNASFTYDGRFNKDAPPILSFTEYTLEGFSHERPEELPKKGDVVWVRDSKDHNWTISIFLEYNPEEKEGPYVVSPNFIEGDHECWKLLTTKNPYANEHN